MDTDRGEPVIMTDVLRASEDHAVRLGELGVATVHESSDGRGLMQAIRPRTPGATTSGPAVTCLNHAGDNLMLHAAVEACQPGDVLVVAVIPNGDYGMFGDLLATSCAARGIRGVIIDSGARDIATIREMGFPLWTRAVTAAGTVKSRPGWVNVPVVCGGVRVEPGDVVVADDDGVVVVPRAAVPDVVTRAEDREAREETSRGRYEGGELSLDVASLRPLLDGVPIVSHGDATKRGNGS